jgi:CRISPR/Cas system-associated exonuclease Cas4 (RecB family)
MIAHTINTPAASSDSDARGSVWSYISPSRLNMWLRCPLAFKLRYVDGVRTATNANLFLGKQVHAGLEQYYRHRMLGIALSAEDVAVRMINGWDAAVIEDAMKFATETDEVALQKQAVDLVAAYLAQIPADEPVPLAVEVRMETPLIDPFSGEDLGIPLLGVTDLIVPGSDGATIVDFKTSSRSTAPSEISHEIQLSSYAYLYRALAGEKESGLENRSLIKTKSPKVVTHRYGARNDTHLRRLFAVLREYVDALDTGRFKYRPSWSGCGMCDFRDTHCRQWAG